MQSLGVYKESTLLEIVERSFMESSGGSSGSSGLQGFSKGGPQGTAPRSPTGCDIATGFAIGAAGVAAGLPAGVGKALAGTVAAGAGVAAANCRR